MLGSCEVTSALLPPSLIFREQRLTTEFHMSMSHGGPLGMWWLEYDKYSSSRECLVAHPSDETDWTAGRGECAICACRREPGQKQSIGSCIATTLQCIASGGCLSLRGPVRMGGCVRIAAQADMEAAVQRELPPDRQVTDALPTDLRWRPKVSSGRGAGVASWLTPGLGLSSPPLIETG